MSKQQTLEALRILHQIFSQGATLPLPSGGLIPYEDPEAYRADLREARKASLLAANKLQEARKRLLASGFEVPDSWLTVNPIIAVDFREDHTGFMGLAYTVEDRQAVSRVCREILAAIMRLENAQAVPSDAELSKEPSEPKTADKRKRMTKQQIEGKTIVALIHKTNNPGATQKEVAETVGIPDSTLGQQDLWKELAPKIEGGTAKDRSNIKASLDKRLGSLDVAANVP